MKHRHLNHQQFTSAAVDDVIARGQRADWQALRAAILKDSALLEKVRALCDARSVDPYAQRYHFWLHYTNAHRNPPANHVSTT